MKVKTLNGNLNIIGKNLKKYRKLRKFSQPEICKKLDLLGVTMYNCDIYEIEYGKKNRWNRSITCPGFGVASRSENVYFKVAGR